MSVENDKTPEMNALEAALSALAPAPSRVDRDELMFRAGAAAAESSASPGARSNSRPAAWLWPLSTAASTLLAATLGVVYGGSGGQRIVERPVAHPVERIVERIVEVPVYIATSAADGSPTASVSRSSSFWPLSTTPIGSSTGSYLQLRDTALARGVDSLSYLQGSRATDSAPPSSYSDLRRDLLPGTAPRASEPDRINSLPQRAQETRT